MKKILAIALTLTLLFALAVSSSAALPSGWAFNGTEDMFKINADGSVSPYYGDPTAGANLGAGYDVSAFNNNFTATVEVFLPELTKVGDKRVTGSPVVTVKAEDPASNAWIKGFALKIVNYEGHAAGTDTNFANWGGTFNVIEAWNPASASAGAPLAVASYADLGIKAGQWNTVKVIVEGNFVTFYVNDVLAVDGIESATNGNYLVLGTNGDGGNPAFRNLVIKSNNGAVADYTAFTATAAGPADIEVVAIVGAMLIALMAAAFVVKARKA
ncbi:MAG: DUF1080 domain-containing protein [Clostridia bacterium]|nr:DUF1080 domain-containing protein [Clostridia bacterium]